MALAELVDAPAQGVSYNKYALSYKKIMVRVHDAEQFLKILSKKFFYFKKIGYISLIITKNIIMRLITIENKLYKITESDWLIFEKKLKDARSGNESEEFEEALLFIENSYNPYDYISGSYNY